MIDAEMSDACHAFKYAVFRWIMKFRKGEDVWWFSSEHKVEDRTRIAKELVAIWKLCILLLHAFYESPSVAEFAHERLDDVQKLLENGEINEQTYIERCNWIKHCKEVDEQLINCCPCHAIGSLSIARGIDEPVLRICCLPCGWDKCSTVVKF